MEGEEQLFVLLNVLIMVLIYKKKKINEKKNKKSKKRSIWSRQWLLRRGSGKDITDLVFKELQFEDLPSFKNYTRMKKETFHKLLGKIEPLIKKQDTVLRESIPASTRLYKLFSFGIEKVLTCYVMNFYRLLLTLRFLATGCTYRELSFNFRISVPAISVIVPETLRAINSSLQSEYLKMPMSKEEWRKVAAEFQHQWNFPHCLGAIDGKHIAFNAKNKDGSFYYNYKGFHSIILLALVDANYCFLYVDVGCNGRVHDAGVYSNSTLCKGIERNYFDFPEEEILPQTEVKLPYVIVADEAFRLSTNFMKPYSHRSTTENKIFNYRLSRSRRVVENAFGIMAHKFRILQKEINLSVEKVELITLSACVLHNFIRKEDGIRYIDDIDKENTSEISFTPARWRSEVFVTGLQRPTGNRSADSPMEIRNRFSNYFNTIGFVPWQWEAVKKFNF